jgi:hypothetical protein
MAIERGEPGTAFGMPLLSARGQQALDLGKLTIERA